MAKQLNEFCKKEDKAKVKDTFFASPQISHVTDTSKVTQFSINDASSTLIGPTTTTERSNDLTSEVTGPTTTTERSNDLTSELTGPTTTTERSNDLTSEVESGAEDSEKQTTSDTDGEKYTGGATDSGDADTQEEGKGEGHKVYKSTGYTHHRQSVLLHPKKQYCCKH
jgi:hypothetical protein